MPSVGNNIQCDLDEENKLLLKKKENKKLLKNRQICVDFEVLMKKASQGIAKQSCGVAGHQVALRTGGESQVSAAQAPQVFWP